MAELTRNEKAAIIIQRQYICEKDGKKNRLNNLEIHHKDHNPHHNDLGNLSVLCKDHHNELHGRGRR